MKFSAPPKEAFFNAMETPLSLHGKPLRCRVWEAGDAGYQPAAHFIRRYYRLAYGARPCIDASLLVTLEDDQQITRAAVGLNPAALRPLFLEQYLDNPIEQAVGERHGAPVPRERIVEVASLAADGSGTGRVLFVALTEALFNQRLDWIAFTATAQVRTMFARLGLAPQRLAEADPARLGEDAGCWGRYYQFRPQVMIGHVPPGYAALTASGWLGTGGQGYDVVA
ncbi:hypothetical protein A11A3_11578 [Alcanivorax hongdengensis A-11-3]|uniref:Thermostable hemolysin n=1 Tax=Alcanivorax hongdengensis A-11-3 TaxID=1177179 RepID=L0WCK9_9GAMM|nr:thermostable hemolysin [Alcanivorax hongdengensis]EKF73847.1 hypothetical protein A11A3_11578 [Alcanivorax hongdengensis A-11-3]